MMSYTIFPLQELSESEMNAIKQKFSDPLVIKYLKLLGTNDSRGLLDLGVLDMPEASIARRHSLISGKLEVIATLLSISQS